MRILFFSFFANLKNWLQGSFFKDFLKSDIRQVIELFIDWINDLAMCRTMIQCICNNYIDMFISKLVLNFTQINIRLSFVNIDYTQFLLFICSIYSFLFPAIKFMAIN